MKTDEIRQTDICAQVGGGFDAGRPEFWLREIAAQLAELNANLRAIHPELNMPEECQKHQCDYFTGYLAYGGPDMSHEAFHSQSKMAESHFKHCSYNGPTICPACQRWEKMLRA
jgi:hypothetical protein